MWYLSKGFYTINQNQEFTNSYIRTKTDFEVLQFGAEDERFYIMFYICLQITIMIFLACVGAYLLTDIFYVVD